MPLAELRPAVFLDRDGTVIRENSYLADPAGVELLSGTAEALRRMAGHGFLLVLVTNQSGIGRGYFTEAQYRAVADRLESLLAGQGVRLDGVYHCPHAPGSGDPCACRKPGLALYRQAAEDLGIDLAGSFWIGDRLRDVAPAQALDGYGILVRTGYGAEEAERAPAGLTVVADLSAAADAVIGEIEG